jgi:uncharacterized protein (TIGR01777 family)
VPHKRYETHLHVSQQELYDYHASGGAFERLVPPWDQIRILRWKGGEQTKELPDHQQFGDLSTGTEVHLKVGPAPFALKLVAKHTEHSQPFGFVDEQVSGPFSEWRHEHRFIQRDAHSSTLVDELTYKTPLFGLFDPFVSSKIDTTFHLRHLRTVMDLTRFESYAHVGAKKVAITGASGLIGRNLSAFLRAAGHQVFHLVRRDPKSPSEIQWNVKARTVDAQALEGMDAVVHLAGESIDGRWTKDKKQRILNSRVEGTKLLSLALAGLEKPPEVLLSASAVGFYGNHPTEVASETTNPSDSFLGKVCQQWEQAANPARDAGIRVVHPRMGVVLSGQGGALKRMLPAFLAGGGGRLGTGTQWMPWVSIEDVLGLMYVLMMEKSISGPVNVVSPNSVQNAAFTKVLGTVINRPTFIPVPKIAIRTLFGEMGQTLLLEGRKVQPTVASSIGFAYRYADLEQALRFELGKFTSISTEETA